MQVESRPATREDIEVFYGREGASPTVKAWIGLVDGEPAAIGGFRYEYGCVVAFFDIRSDRLRQAKIAIVKGAKAVMADARANGYRFVYAAMDPNEPTAPRFLTRLGFEQDNLDPSLFVWRPDR